MRIVARNQIFFSGYVYELHLDGRHPRTMTWKSTTNGERKQRHGHHSYIARAELAGGLQLIAGSGRPPCSAARLQGRP